MTEHNELPELPAAAYLMPLGDRCRTKKVYTADQMRDYANACRLAGGVTVDDGYKLVPVEPTDAMVDAALLARNERIKRRAETNVGYFVMGGGDARVTMKETYKAMISASVELRNG